MNPAQYLIVIEDDADGQELVGKMLRHMKIDFDVVQSAEDALTLMSQNQYTGAIVDLALPGMDGWTLLDNVRSNPDTAHMSCVAITAYHSADLAVKAVDAGFNGYFPKPIDPAHFVRELPHALN